MKMRDVRSDEFIDDARHWSRSTARQLAKQEGIEPLGDDHWRVIDYLREHYLVNRTLPVMKHLCRELELEEGCVGRLFGNPEVAWLVAGLPDPGEEARAYMDASEVS